MFATSSGSKCAFAAVKEDGSVVTWGSCSFGDTVKAELQGGVLQMNANVAV